MSGISTSENREGAPDFFPQDQANKTNTDKTGTNKTTQTMQKAADNKNITTGQIGHPVVHVKSISAVEIKNVDKAAAERFCSIASKKGMSKEEIDAHLRFISDNFEKWVTNRKDFIIKKGGKEGLARTIEYSSETQTVFTHFKKKIGPAGTSKGKPLGEGQFSVVKQSIVSASTQLTPAADIAEKIPKDKNTGGAAILEEGRVNLEFKCAQNVRHVFRISEKGLLLEGMKTNLESRLKEANSMSPEEKLNLMRGLSNGLHEMHEKGYVHQDIHKGNCFVSSEGVWKLGDLGTAQKIANINSKPIHLSIASPQRMCAQMFHTNVKTQAADDLWSLGLILYEMEHGAPAPFAAAKNIKALEEAIEERDQCLREIHALPRALKSLIFKWNGKNKLDKLEIPAQFAKDKENVVALLAKFAANKAKFSELYEQYAHAITEFHQKFIPLNEVDSLIKSLLDPQVDGRMTTEDLLAKTKSLSEESFKNGSVQDLDKVEAVSQPNQALQTSSGSGYTENKSEYAENKPDIKKTSPSAKGGYNESSGYTNNIINAAPKVVRIRSDEEKLTEAVKQGNIGKLTKFLEKGVDVAAFRLGNGNTLLHLAAQQHGSAELLEFLCKIGADPNAKNQEGKSPLHCAGASAYVLGGEILMKYGGDIEAKDHSGKTPIDYAKSAQLIFLDEHKLLAGKSTEEVNPIFVEWYKNQAVLLQFLTETPGVSEKGKLMLSQLALNALNKAASQSTELSEAFGLQMSPLLPSTYRYHRSTPNMFLTKAENYLNFKDLNILDSPRLLIHSPLALDALIRSLSKFDAPIKIKNRNDFAGLLEFMKTNSPPVVVDISDFLLSKEDPCSALVEFMDLWNKKADEFLRDNNVDIKNSDIIVLGFSSYKGSDVLYIPTVSHASGIINKSNRERITDILRHNGLVPSPDKTIETWLKCFDLPYLLKNQSLPEATLATAAGKIPVVCQSIDNLLSHNVAKKFLALSRSNDASAAVRVPPYLKVLPEATITLLKGLSQRDVEKAFADEGLSELLQFTYFKIINAMSNALARVDDYPAFINEIELIHQEIQNILAILSINNAYGPNDFHTAASQKFTSAMELPEQIKPNIYLKPSAMASLSSVLASIEAQKGTKQLNVAVLEDTYYEGAGNIRGALNYKMTTIQGDKFRQDPQSAGLTDAPPAPFDLFLCEFHHNLSINRNEYYPEDVEGQLLALNKKGLLANPCTILIDTTIDLEKSEQIKSFMENMEIQELIKDGKLNVVFLRSAQKFDMLGMDNYYGGVTTVLNNGSFKKFNARMDLPEDQLSGLSYQGVTHLETYAEDFQDKYRLGIMENTQLLYKMLPKEMISGPKNNNPIQISQIHDSRIVFLDIKSPEHTNLAKEVGSALLRMSKRDRVLITNRSSFGFPNTNYTIINGQGVRLNPGLEDDKTIEKIAAYFRTIQETITKALEGTAELTDEEKNTEVLAAVSALS